MSLVSFSYPPRPSHSCWGFIVRTALQQYPENIRTLITVLATQFIRLIRSHTFPRPNSATFALPLSPWPGSSTADDIRSVLNCACVIARVLPIVWEDESDWTRWLWEEEEEEEEAESSLNDNEGQAQFVIEDEDDDEPDAEQQQQEQPKVEAREPAKKKSPSLMARFMSALIDSLFHAGFTLPADVVEGTEKTSYLIWYRISQHRQRFNLIYFFQGLWCGFFEFTCSSRTYSWIPLDSAANIAIGLVASSIRNSHQSSPAALSRPCPPLHAAT